jgi:hypothetical protein
MCTSICHWQAHIPLLAVWCQRSKLLLHVFAQPHNIVRATAQVGLLCETTIKDGAQGEKKEELTRDDIATKVFYASTIRYDSLRSPT